MFCSKCGKTLPANAEKCPVCGRIVGESLFEGMPYTSVQSHIQPGEDLNKIYSESYTPNNYIRTTYMGKPDEAATGDVDTRTTYRPTFDGDSIPEEMRSAVEKNKKAAADADEAEAPVEGTAESPAEDVPAENAPAEDAPSEEDLAGLGDLDMSRFRASPIESSGQAGIRPEITEMMMKISSNPRHHRSQRPAAFDDYDNTIDTDMDSNPDMNGQSDVFDDLEDEDFDEIRHSSFGFKQVLQIIIALVLIAGLVIGGVSWFNYIRGNHSNAPIENVTEEMYNAAIPLVKKHASTEYVNQVLMDYKNSGNNLISLSSTLEQASSAMKALLPAEPTENEQLLMQALTQIETNISNCIISDAMALSQNDANAVAESDARWTVVNNSIKMLESAKSAVELTAIINGEVVDVQEASATPTPEPAVNYNTLSKGDKSDEVLDMQNRLFELGFLKDDRDGAFGGKTQTAVKIFQQMSGLPITGIADSETLNALYAEDAVRADAQSPAQTTPSPEAGAQ